MTIKIILFQSYQTLKKKIYRNTLCIWIISFKVSEVKLCWGV